MPSGDAVPVETSVEKPRAMTSVMKSPLHACRGKKGGNPPPPPPPAEAEESAVPDSTTSPPADKQETAAADFVPGQDVLLKQKDDRFYLGTVRQVDCIREQCLLRFEDNTERWSGFKDLVKLSATLQEDILCVVCKKSAPKRKQEITVCDKCGRGYHRKCHQPEIPLECQKEDSMWMCKRCLGNETQRLKRSEPKRDLTTNAVLSTNASPFVMPSIKTFPYDLSSLTWDTYHRVNGEHTYCYCGDNGEWYKQMLQCFRCKQWFHEKCMDCLQYPLYCGDRFYVFFCCICNNGKEFLRRIELKWVDVVHLVLFNLTAYNSKKYYDLDTTIIPYMSDNWHALQLPPKIASVTKNERRDNILSVLTNNRNRFKCGREIKKRTTIWGLRVRLPPPAPTLPTGTLDFSGSVREEKLRELWQGNRRLQFLPMPPDAASGKKVVPCDAHMRNLMMGVAYQCHGNPSESDSPCPSPEAPDDPRDAMDPLKLYKGDFLGAGCAKKSAPIVSSSNIKLQQQKKKKKRLLALMGGRERVLRRPKRRNTNDGIGGRGTSGRAENSEAVGGYVTRLSLDNKMFKGSTATSETLPLTPPTSVSAPPTPPASGSNSLLSDVSNSDFFEHAQPAGQSNTNNKATTKSSTFTAGLDALHSTTDLNNTPCDTSGDETSSKSTLDLIIPPPKDFEGKNNPFLTLLRGTSNNAATEELPKKRKSKDSITLPLPLTAVIPGKPVMRPTKRQLSEKDIVIGPNGEVKRRRLRRTRVNPAAYVAGQTASKTAAVVPARPDSKEWKNASPNSQIGGCVGDYINVRRLRQRPDKTQDKPPPQPSPKPSPVKQEPEINMDDLKNSVNMYFGAANRIAGGERFTVKAKRIGPTGKLEFLIEWEGATGPMT